MGATSLVASHPILRPYSEYPVTHAPTLLHRLGTYACVGGATFLNALKTKHWVVDPGHPPKYPPTTGGQHLLDMIAATFDYRRDGAG